MDKKEAKKIAELARLEMENLELEKVAGEMSSILEYIDKIKSADVSSKGNGEASSEESRIENAGVRNIMTEDENPHENGINTDVLVKEMPESQDNMAKVKKIM